MSDGGKGSGSRPMEVPREVYESNHDRIFGKRERVQYVPPPLPDGAECLHQHTIARPEDDISIMRCIDCGAAVPWLCAREPLPDEPLVDGYQEKARDQ